ncbi:MAG: hypothetical protein AAFY39_08530 [Pseudomonadota bacterium]
MAEFPALADPTLTDEQLNDLFDLLWSPATGAFGPGQSFPLTSINWGSIVDNTNPTEFADALVGTTGDDDIDGLDGNDSVDGATSATASSLMAATTSSATTGRAAKVAVTPCSAAMATTSSQAGPGTIR